MNRRIGRILRDKGLITDYDIACALSINKCHIDSDGNAVFKGGIRLDLEGTECETAETLIVDVSVGIGTAAPVETLEVNGAVRIGNTSNTVNGIIRWTGSDFEGYKNGWISLTGGSPDPKVHDIIDAYGANSSEIFFVGGDLLYIFYSNEF